MNVARTGLYAGLLFAAYAAAASAQSLGPEHVLLVCNDNSLASHYIVELYRQLYPQISEQQVVYLQGLADAAAVPGDPADEIITREDFETYIAQPIRDHLINHELVNQIRLIVTTAGIPYRIEDNNWPGVIQPAACNGGIVINNVTQITAASVESELAVLFQIDPALPAAQRMWLEGRMVNVYQGYRTSMAAWQERDILARRTQMNWTTPWGVGDPPWMEGTVTASGSGVEDRLFSPADIYLTARLDGPRTVTRSPIFAVGVMLDRARLASNPAVGVNPSRVRLVMDDAPSAPYDLDRNRAFNTDGEPEPPDDYLPYLTNPPFETPPDMSNPLSRDDMARAFLALTGQEHTPEVINLQSVLGIGHLKVLYDHTDGMVNSGAREIGDRTCLALITFGVNGDDDRGPRYLLTGGPEGEPLFRYPPGACFTAHESYNAVTLFTSSWVGQGMIAEFIETGGTAAIGHAFEPFADGIIDAEFFFPALVTDADGDDRADLTAVEAFFSGLPFLSWTGVCIGDPLMRLAYNRAANVVINPTPIPGDCDLNGYVNVTDLTICVSAYGTQLGEPLYDHQADIDQSLSVDYTDFVAVVEHYGEGPPPDLPPTGEPGEQ